MLTVFVAPNPVGEEVTWLALQPLHRPESCAPRPRSEEIFAALAAVRTPTAPQRSRPSGAHPRRLQPCKRSIHRPQPEAEMIVPVVTATRRARGPLRLHTRLDESQKVLRICAPARRYDPQGRGPPPSLQENAPSCRRSRIRSFFYGIQSRRVSPGIRLRILYQPTGLQAP